MRLNPALPWLMVFPILAALLAASVTSPALAGVAARDTTVLLGGPDRWDGRFETEAGLPDWHGWTSVDYSARRDTLWQVSTFNAADLGGHGPGNQAMWCGREFGGGEGYGNYWRESLQWSWPVADPQSPHDVALHARLSHDTEPGFDRLYLRVWRGDGWQDLRRFEGWRVDRSVDIAFTVHPGEFGGEVGDEIRVRWVFESDGLWSDEDGLYPTDGGCQIDDIEMVVDGETATFDAFEPDGPVAWVPVLDSGVGDFAQLAAGLHDLDPCRGNDSWQVCFVDDGEVVPGTGGSGCIQWCYGPGGYVLNSDGGVLGPTYHLENGIVSPALAWPDGCHDGLLEFDVWRHEMLMGDTPGMFYRWRVRSTASADPLDLDDAPWQGRGDTYFGDPDYIRHQLRFGDLLVPGRRWIQVELAVVESGWLWGYAGHDATPAPYFDNVGVKAFPVTGTSIIVRDADLPQDAFPASKVLDLANLGTNSCRFDMARDISGPGDTRIVAGDSVVATMALLRDGAFYVGLPRMVARIHCNPLFDPHRLLSPPGGQGYVQTLVQGDSCRTVDGTAVRNRWFFDLPDQNLLFPGDVVHFYLDAVEFLNGELTWTSWPADTTGFSDFSPTSSYPRAATMRALPTLHDAQGTQPELLFWQDFDSGDDPYAWTHALANLGLVEGVDYDRYITREPNAGHGNGLGGRASASVLTGYQSLLYACGDHVRATFAVGDARVDPTQDLLVLYEWMLREGGRVLFSGDNVASSLAATGAYGQGLLSAVLRVSVASENVVPLIGNQVSPLVRVIPGNPIIDSVPYFRLAGTCPDRRAFDALSPQSGGTRIAEFTDRNGQGGVYTYAAIAAYDQPLYSFRTVTLPVAFSAIIDDPAGGGDGQPIPARARLLGDILTWFGTTTGDPIGVPAAEDLSVRSYPNPFNPAATIAFRLPAAARVELAVYDIRGRLVRRLLDGMLPAGPGEVLWDGTGDDGESVASGVYFHEFKALGEVRIGRMTLLR